MTTEVQTEERKESQAVKNWFTRHADTIVILGTFASCFFWLNEKMNDRFNILEKDMTVIKTVLVMKNIMPNELANLNQSETEKKFEG